MLQPATMAWPDRHDGTQRVCSDNVEKQKRSIKKTAAIDTDSTLGKAVALSVLELMESFS